MLYGDVALDYLHLHLIVFLTLNIYRPAPVLASSVPQKQVRKLLSRLQSS